MFYTGQIDVTRRLYIEKNGDEGSPRNENCQVRGMCAVSGRFMIHKQRWKAQAPRLFGRSSSFHV